MNFMIIWTRFWMELRRKNPKDISEITIFGFTNKDATIAEKKFESKHRATKYSGRLRDYEIVDCCKFNNQVFGYLYQKSKGKHVDLSKDCWKMTKLSHVKICD